jgi:hypothetical protein
MDDQEQFAENIRQAGKSIARAEYELAQADAEERRIIAQAMVMAEARGDKTHAKQSRTADEDAVVFQARLDRGKAKGKLAAAKTNLAACEVEFKVWQSTMANLRFEKNRIYNHQG